MTSARRPAIRGAWTGLWFILYALDGVVAFYAVAALAILIEMPGGATIFLPITFVTGVFGMNFADQPWLHTNFWLWMLFMAGVAGLTFWWFRRHRWV